MHPDSAETPGESQTLSAAISAATATIHTKINKLILPRVPLALPPNTQDPSLYVTGLLHIAPIYLTFELLWKEIVESTPTEERTNPSEEKTGHPHVSERMHKILTELAAPELMRSNNLKADIQSMTGWSPDVVAEQLEFISKTGHLGEFTSHIRRAIKNKPHVILSYSYLMLMALFNGGRYIRARLARAGHEFWTQVASPIKPMMRPCEAKSMADGATTDKMDDVSLVTTPGDLPLRYFHFNATEDGELLKSEYKRVFNDSERLLTRQERSDILQEAVCIFENFGLIVAQLDAVVSQTASAQSGSPVSAASMSTVIAPPLADRFRDSVAVAKERMARDAKGPDAAGETAAPAEPTKDAKLPAVTEHADMTAADAPILAPKVLSTDPEAEKAVRFKPLPEPGVVQPMECLKTASKQLGREQVTSWVVLAAIGFVLLGAAFSSRRVSLEA